MACCYVAGTFSFLPHRSVSDPFSWPLFTVADAQGLSYYADKTLCRLLRLDAGLLGSAPAELIANRLIAYQRP